MQHAEEFTWKHQSRIHLEISFSTWKLHQITINGVQNAICHLGVQLSLITYQFENYIAKLKARNPTL